LELVLNGLCGADAGGRGREDRSRPRVRVAELEVARLVVVAAGGFGRAWIVLAAGRKVVAVRAFGLVEVDDPGNRAALARKDAQSPAAVVNVLGLAARAIRIYVPILAGVKVDEPLDGKIGSTLARCAEREGDVA